MAAAGSGAEAAAARLEGAGEEEETETAAAAEDGENEVVDGGGGAAGESEEDEEEEEDDDDDDGDDDDDVFEVEKILDMKTEGVSARRRLPSAPTALWGPRRHRERPPGRPAAGGRLRRGFGFRPRPRLRVGRAGWARGAAAAPAPRAGWPGAAGQSSGVARPCSGGWLRGAGFRWQPRRVFPSRPKERLIPVSLRKLRFCRRCALCCARAAAMPGWAARLGEGRSEQEDLLRLK